MVSGAADFAFVFEAALSSRAAIRVEVEAVSLGMFPDGRIRFPLLVLRRGRWRIFRHLRWRPAAPALAAVYAAIYQPWPLLRGQLHGEPRHAHSCPEVRDGRGDVATLGAHAAVELVDDPPPQLHRPGRWCICIMVFTALRRSLSL